VRAAVDNESEVIECDECPKGYECNDVAAHCCPTKEHACALEYDTGRYASQGSHTPRYFFNPAVNNCLLFTYYGALGNANNFETYNECVRFCKGATGGSSNAGNATATSD